MTFSFKNIKVKNSQTAYGPVSKLLHWLSAVIIIGLFVLGFWMVGLDYYSQWYKTAPDWHRSVGILLCLATILRLWWKLKSITPSAVVSHSVSTVKLAKITHFLLYLLLFIIFISGYLISTAEGQNIAVFTWFEIPAFGEFFNEQADIAGTIHEYMAYVLITLALLHAAAAIKHHVKDKDETLSRML